MSRHLWASQKNHASVLLLAFLLPLAPAMAANPGKQGVVPVTHWEGPVQRPTFGNYIGEPDIAPELLTEGFLAAHPDIRWRREGLYAFNKKRYDEAYNCFRRAARYADKASMAMLAEMYWKGLGVTQDKEIGYVWMDLAAERMYPNFLILRERYWGELSQAEQAAAIKRGQPVLAEFGDDVAKRRLNRVLKREMATITGSRVGYVGSLMIYPMTGPLGGSAIPMLGDEYYNRDYWRPEYYWKWQDKVWKAPPEGKVEVGDLEPVHDHK
jgi:hypothetical protein